MSLIFVDTKVRINQPNNITTVKNNSIMPIINKSADEVFILKLDSAQAHRARETIKLACRPNFANFLWILQILSVKFNS